ncbi:MAG: hypothetical protein IKW35_08915 [Paludibacteraceae bacterium]|nr:hypothetical protein [Paludibacteraceae bacterium]
MRNFESQLSAFGKHRYAQTTKHLRSAVNPRRRDRSLLWVTTPAAAVAGIIIGLGIQVNSNFKEQVTAHFEDNKTVKQVVELPEFCYTDFESAIELPEFEIVINQLNTEL